MPDNLLDRVERLVASLLTWLIDHVPMPSRLRRGLQSRRRVINEMVKFTFAGVGATVVFYTTYNLLRIGLGMSNTRSFLVANVPAILAAYVISAHFVFSNHSGKTRRTEVVMFFALNACGVAIGYFALGLVELAIGRPLENLGANVVPALAVLASWALRFFIARRFIFKSHLERPPVDVATEVAHVAEELDENVELEVGLDSPK
ncbi:MAG: GtrA family protein [Acidimicrobiia bacterium]|nr:GtrA family protein [Acidimicrobiia bacterium]